MYLLTSLAKAHEGPLPRLKFVFSKNLNQSFLTLNRSSKNINQLPKKILSHPRVGKIKVIKENSIKISSINVESEDLVPQQ